MCKFSHMTPMIQEKYETKICKYSERGYCKFGNMCKFSHVVSVMSCETRICKHFVQGYCKFGNNCPFVHRSILTSGINKSRKLLTNQTLAQRLLTFENGESDVLVSQGHVEDHKKIYDRSGYYLFVLIPRSDHLLHWCDNYKMS